MSIILVTGASSGIGRATAQSLLDRGHTVYVAARRLDAMWQMFEPDLRRRLVELDAAATTAQRVRSALLELLPGGQSGIGAVASRLAMSTRTLQRRLDEEGDSFRNVVNRTREDLAEHYLTQTTLSASEIGFLLGFEDPNSFFRAFHGWTGKTPDALRTSVR